jgi:hypothetical protein
LALLEIHSPTVLSFRLCPAAILDRCRLVQWIIISLA